MLNKFGIISACFVILRPDSKITNPMIQRIQSIYLSLAALLGLSALKIPVWKFTYTDEFEMVNALQMYSPLDDQGSM